MRSRSASHGLGDAAALDWALAQLAGGQHGVVAAWQLLQLGFSRRQIWFRLRRGQLHELHHGVYAVGHRSLTRHGRWLAAVLAVGPDAFLSHRDGLALHEVADFTFPEIDVSLPLLGSRSRRGIRIHRTRRVDPLELAVVDGIPVSSLARTFIDLAGSISPRHLREAYLEAEREELVDVDAFSRVLRDGRGKKGIRYLQALVAEDTAKLGRTRSPLEARFFDFCRERSIPLPEPNHWVAGYELDAYWPEARLAVELDSYEFHRGRKAFEADRAKIGDLRLAGIAVIPVTDRRLKREPTKLAEIIRQSLAARARAEADREPYG